MEKDLSRKEVERKMGRLLLLFVQGLVIRSNSSHGIVQELASVKVTADDFVIELLHMQFTETVIPEYGVPAVVD